MSLHTHHQRQQGFTLIELLVVVAIIALLISILLPSLSRARTIAKRTVCATQLKDIGIGLATYEVNFNRLPPQNWLGASAEAVGSKSTREASAMWGYSVHAAIAESVGGMAKYLEGDTTNVANEPGALAMQTFYCPFVDLNDIHEIGDIVYSQFGDNIPAGASTMNTFDNFINITYTYFGRLDEVVNDPASEGNNSNGLGYLDDVSADRIQQKRRKYAGKIPNSDDILMTDSVAAWPSGQSNNGVTLPWRINHPNLWDSSMRDTGDAGPEFDGANQMFADGHVEWKPSEQMPELSDPGARIQRWINAATLKRESGMRGEAYWW